MHGSLVIYFNSKSKLLFLFVCLLLSIGLVGLSPCFSKFLCKLYQVFLSPSCNYESSFVSYPMYYEYIPIYMGIHTHTSQKSYTNPLSVLRVIEQSYCLFIQRDVVQIGLALCSSYTAISSFILRYTFYQLEMKLRSIGIFTEAHTDTHSHPHAAFKLHVALCGELIHWSPESINFNLILHLQR